MATDDRILIRLPRAHWQQIVNNIADMAGTSDCEILSQVEEDLPQVPELWSVTEAADFLNVSHQRINQLTAADLCDTEWLRHYTEHIHVCILSNQHTTPHQCECHTTKPVKRTQFTPPTPDERRADQEWAQNGGH